MPDRRHAVPFDPEYFTRRAAAGEVLPALAAFRHAYASNHWAGAESRSGPGSAMEQTAAVRAQLPPLCRRLDVRTLLDVPCGDHGWMATVNLDDIQYIGGDLVPELVDVVARRHGRPGREFRVLDLLTSALPDAELLLCRDCLVHLSFADIARAVDNMRRARITWLLTTTFPDQRSNADVVTGDWRPLNLMLPPFGWPAPAELINERCTEGNGIFADKSLGLWRIADLPGTAR